MLFRSSYPTPSGFEDHTLVQENTKKSVLPENDFEKKGKTVKSQVDDSNTQVEITHLTNENTITDLSQMASKDRIQEEFQRSYKEIKTESVKSKTFKISFLIPGILVLLVWLFGNILPEEQKQNIFKMDDLSPLLTISIIFLIVGGIVSYIRGKM